MTRSPATLEAEAESSRRALDADMHALRRKLRPRRMIGDAARRTGAGARRMAGRVAERARTDPFPFVMGGAIAAAAWLIAFGRRTSRPAVR